MAIVKRTKSTKSETSATIDIFENKKVSDEEKSRAIEEVGEFLIEQTLSTIAEAKSPVSGENIPALSKSYKKYKVSQARDGIANLEFTGRMHEQLAYVPTDKGLRLGVFGERAKVSDAHNQFSGESDLPRRRYIPGEGQKYRAKINEEINRIVAESVARSNRDKISRNRLSGITTRAAFDRYMSEVFEGLSRSEIRSAVMGNAEFFNIIGEFNLLRFLNG